QADATQVFGTSDDGQTVVGEWRDTSGGGPHGFVLTGAPFGVYTSFDAPGSIWTTVQGANNVNVQVGWWLDAGDGVHPFRIDAGVLTDVPVPGLVQPQLTGITDGGLIVGNSVNPPQSFLMLGTVVQTYSVPGSQLTEIFAIRNDGTIFGRF